MKANRIRHGKGGVLAVAGLVLVVLIGVGIMLGYEKLRGAWLEQCVVRSMERQVEIESGKMVKADVIAENLGIRPGANLALIDFAEKRAEILRRIPNLKNIRIRRRLPDRVSVSIEERTPIARLNVRGRKTSSDKVVDSEGVVFLCARGTGLLPVIREASAPGTAAGHRLDGRARAALQFVEACRDPEFQELSVLDVDVAKPDYISATIASGPNYMTLKITWDGMDEPATPASRSCLVRKIKQFRNAVRTGAGTGAVIWNATMPNRVFADTKGKL